MLYIKVSNKMAHAHSADPDQTVLIATDKALFFFHPKNANIFLIST